MLLVMLPCCIALFLWEPRRDNTARFKEDFVLWVNFCNPKQTILGKLFIDQLENRELVTF